MLNEPRHDTTKPTKWLCPHRRLRSAWASAQSDHSIRCPREETLGPKLSITCAQRRLRSDWADAQADLSFRWAHTHFVGSVVSRLKFCYTIKDLYLNVFKALVEGNQGRFTRTVGRENYYLQYEVRVTAFNEFGEGPTSPPGVYIYSAEDCEFSMFTKREPVL